MSGMVLPSLSARSPAHTARAQKGIKLESPRVVGFSGTVGPGASRPHQYFLPCLLFLCAGLTLRPLPAASLAPVLYVCPELAWSAASLQTPPLSLTSWATYPVPQLKAPSKLTISKWTCLALTSRQSRLMCAHLPSACL